MVKFNQIIGKMKPVDAALFVNADRLTTLLQGVSSQTAVFILLLPLYQMVAMYNFRENIKENT